MSNFDFLSYITLATSQPLSLCYHCHKCTSGCPVVEEMDYGPDQILRMVQLGEKEALLSSRDIWLCASCETCGTRCPNGIDIAHLMDGLREMAVTEGAPIPEPDAVKFHRLFLLVVQNMGRMHELILLAAFKLWTLHLLSDMDSGARMFVKGKVPLLPERFRAKKEIRQIFEKTRDSAECVQRNE